MFCSCFGFYLYFSFSLTLSLPLTLYSFCSGHNIDCDNGIFLGFALFGCLAVVCYFVYSFWYLQLCLFYFCLSGATILTVINNGIFLLVFALFVCVVCHYCLSGATILTLINHEIFVLVFALIVCIVSCFSRSSWVHVFPLSVLYAF